MEEAEKIIAERIELDTLVERGVEFTVPGKSVLRHIWPNRSFTIKAPYRGTQIYIDRECIDMDFSEGALLAGGMNEARRVVAHNNRRFAKIVAIAVLRDYWKIKLLTGLLTHYFLWRIDSKKTQQLAGLIIPLSGIPNFLDSIRYLSIQKRVTAPALMEKPEETPAD
ncbi:hypothetical protein [Spirosoma validum]|uniref:Uncharacterized protein n=1 Tax=Spirosoma validum TaxID=2771355 RepID=A0A927B1Z2_9BACT|nr:hypothetical protein [Spirosoma validum]MBD2753782.1 hypothetical protein [Spirosoma validum]